MIKLVVSQILVSNGLRLLALHETYPFVLQCVAHAAGHHGSTCGCNLQRLSLHAGRALTHEDGGAATSVRHASTLTGRRLPMGPGILLLHLDVGRRVRREVDRLRGVRILLVHVGLARGTRRIE